MSEHDDGGAIDLADMYTDHPPLDFIPEEQPIDPAAIEDKDDDSDG